MQSDFRYRCFGRMWFLRIALLIFVASYGSDMLSQEFGTHFFFSHLSTNEGLSSNKINCIYEDEDHFMWFGTEDGLNLYDGISVKVFKSSPKVAGSFTGNSVYSIVEDPNNGNLWIGTQDGLCYFDKETYKFTPLLQEDKYRDFSVHNVFHIVLDQNRALWLSTSYGLFCYKPDKDELLMYVHDDDDAESIISNRIYHVFIDEEEHVLVATRAGLDLLDPQTGVFEHLFQEEGLSNVMQVYKDSEEQLWVCTDYKGLFRIQIGEEPKLIRESFNSDLLNDTDRIHSVIEDDEHNLYFCVRDKGLLFYNRIQDKLSLHVPDKYNMNGLNSKALISAYKSTSGIIWFGTFSNGVNYIDYNRKPFEHYKINYKDDGLFNNNVRSFFQDEEGKIWIGTKEGGGLSLFTPKTGTFVNYIYDKSKENSISSDYILSINELNEYTLILGTLKQGIDLFNKRTGQFSNIKIPSSRNDLSDNNIYSIFKDLSDTIWVASLTNLFLFDWQNMEFKLIEGINSVKCIDQNSKEGGLWFGTKFNGLINVRNGKQKVYTDNDSINTISSNNITALCFENDSMLWLGTMNGLNLINIFSGHVTSWFEKDGLPSNRISALEIDDQNRVWISTTNGLSRFDQTLGEFKNYYVSDGLQGNGFETYISLKADDGAMYFGGSNGFNRFYPGEIVDNLHIPEIHFTDFKIANQSLRIDSIDSPLKKHIDRVQHIRLKHDEADFTFEFVALNFTSPEKNSFRYMLEGYDDDWNYSGGNKFATYTNIQPGDYIFKVTGSNNDDHWSEEGRRVGITIMPPPWKSIWAYIIYLLLIVIISYAFYSSIVRRIEQQNQIKHERQEREKLEQINQMKLRFFTNISHEFRTPLTLISSPLSKLMESDNIPDSERDYLHQTMNRNVKRLLRLIKQLMDFRKLENHQIKIRVKEGKLSFFISEIIFGFTEFAANKNIKIIFDSNVKEDEECWFDHQAIDGVIFNLLSNALKFSNTDSEIHVRLRIGSDRVAEIAVKDFGVGISADRQANVFDRFYSEDQGLEGFSGTGIGLAFSKNMILIHHGDIKVSSVPGEGACFTLRIPVSKSAYHEDEIIETSHASSWEATVIDVNQDALETEKEESFNDESEIEEGKVQLLIAEDNVELRQFLESQFSKYKVIAVNDGHEAFEKSKEYLPDIIISDIMMPKMNGIQFCKALKEDHRTSHIPIILLTAKTAIEHKIEGIEQGADAYIEKPFDFSLLEAQVNNLLSQREILRARFKNHSGVSIRELASNSCDHLFFEKAENIVKDHLGDEAFSVDELCLKLNLSRSQLFRKFKNVTGYNPSEYIRIKRIELAKNLLKEGKLNVNEVSEKTGFSSSSYFISIFKKNTGLTPREYLQE